MLSFSFGEYCKETCLVPLSFIYSADKLAVFQNWDLQLKKVFSMFNKVLVQNLAGGLISWVVNNAEI